MSHATTMPDSHVFRHDAMNTTFEFRLLTADHGEARDLARECSDHLDLLEQRLSRFVDGSDISRINELGAGETLYLTEETHRCLRLALEAHAATGGLFDVTIGARIAHRKNQSTGPPPPLAGTLALHADVPAITCTEPGRQIDLGGIGKGFALDELHALLLDRETRGALLASGASTLLAFGPEPWPVTLTGNRDHLRIDLQDMALGASGTGFQGEHIVDPRDQADCGGLPWTRVWVAARTAAQADAWSTAVMLMDRADIDEFLTTDEVAQGIWVEHGVGIECLRPLPQPTGSQQAPASTQP